MLTLFTHAQTCFGSGLLLVLVYSWFTLLTMTEMAWSYSGKRSMSLCHCTLLHFSVLNYPKTQLMRCLCAFCYEIEVMYVVYCLSVKCDDENWYSVKPTMKQFISFNFRFALLLPTTLTQQTFTYCLALSTRADDTMKLKVSKESCFNGI